MVATYPVDYSSIGGHKRPYLEVHLTGPDGVAQPIIGVVDSGADYTCLPYEMLRLLGYEGRSMLRESGISQVSGALDALQSTVPIGACVAGLPEKRFELFPVFVQGARNVLWGRADFFKAFESVGFLESEERFELAFEEPIAEAERPTSA